MNDPTTIHSGSALDGAITAGATSAEPAEPAEPRDEEAEALPPAIRRRWMIAIAAMAVILRVAVALQPGFLQADELWQYVEPAYGWVTGRWIQSWEFHVGLRGWLLPALFAPVLAIGHAIAPGTQAGLMLLRVVVAMAALVIPLVFWQFGRRISPTHGLIAGWVGAIWAEVFYFAPRTSTENLATIAIFAALALTLARGGKTWSRLAIGGAGLCLALAACTRFQYLPAIGLVALGIIWREPGRRLPWLVTGGLLGLAFAGGADRAAGGTPFGWVLTNFAMNFSQRRSTFFGTEPLWWFLQQILLTWSWGSLFILPALCLGARRFPLLALVAAATVASHSLIDHKEYRFILLAVQILVLLAAIGSLDLLRGMAKVLPFRQRSVQPKRALLVLAPLWFAGTVIAATSTPFVDNWGNGRLLSQSLAIAAGDPKLCGIATFRRLGHPAISYALLDRDVPILLLGGSRAADLARANQARFNYVLTTRTAGRELPSSYRLLDCRMPHKAPENQHYCLFARPGSCHGGAGDFDYNTVMTRLGS